MAVTLHYIHFADITLSEYRPRLNFALVYFDFSIYSQSNVSLLNERSTLVGKYENETKKYNSNQYSA